VTGVAPVLAPTLGAQLLRFTDWRGIFWVLAGIGTVLIAVVTVGLRETLPPERRRRGGAVETARTYGRLVRERRFIGLMLTGGLMMGALFAYISGSSFVLQDGYGLSEQDYGLLFGINSVGLVLGTQVNARVAVRHGPHRVLGVAVSVAAVSAATLVVTASTGAFGLAGIVVPLFFMISTIGFTLPNVPILALANHGRTAGTAAGLIGASNFAFGGISAPLVGALGTASAVPMAAVMAAATLGAATALFAVVRPHTLNVDHATVDRSRSPVLTSHHEACAPGDATPSLVNVIERQLHDRRGGAGESQRDGVLVRAGLAARGRLRPGPDHRLLRRRDHRRRVRSRA
ncbi:MAG TPA: MFS transporter, partial [Jiangellaceae bacterium]|nr:MFS transporter [Jiangellaceae bacterium]